jgi:hypothetical protein
MNVLSLKNKEEKQLRQFIRGIIKMPPERFIGVTKLLGVELMEDKTEEEILEEKKIQFI